MKEIYTKAALTKCSKPKALEILEKLYTNMSEDDKQKNVDDIARLFSFFTPKATNKKVKTLQEWVNLAVSDEEVRYYLRATHSDGKYLVATDGHRLHRMETDLPVGYYNRIGEPIDIDGTFPDCEGLFFNTENKVKVTLDIEKAELSKYNKKWAYFFDVMGTPFVFNKKYVDQARNGKTVLEGYIDVLTNSVDNKDVIDNILTQEHISHPFQSEDGSLMLMPMRLSTNG